MAILLMPFRRSRVRPAVSIPQRSRTPNCELRSNADFLFAILAITAILSLSKLALAEGSAAAGAASFKALCASCHTSIPERNSIGPSLYGVFARKAGQARAYTYSTAMLHSDIIWTEQSLAEFLTAPRAKVPGTKMTFTGIPTASQRDDVIAFLKSLGAPQN